jgi:hypothetical protein
MQPTITQNGALYAVQHRFPQKDRGPRHKRATADQLKIFPTLRTPMGEFALRSMPVDEDASARQESAQVADAFPEYQTAA